MSEKLSLNELHPPIVGAEQVQLLERLCNACAVSGDESEVRAIVKEQVSPHVDQVTVDALGNLLARRQGEGEYRLRVMLAAHMDEVGFMITEDEGEGIYRFDLVGGLDTQQLVGKPVWIGRDHIPGVIGTKPIHLIKKDELSQPVAMDALRIDIGLGTSSKVKVGDRATFATTFSQIGPSLRAKALDNRVGVATLIELIKQPLPNIDLLAAFTVQEEVGLRGARVAAYALNPQVAFVLESTPAYDFPSWEAGGYHPGDGTENTRYNTRLGAGPAIYVADRYTLTPPRLLRHLVETAEAHNIPYQFRQPGGGGTDAGVIHYQREGIPSISIAVPGRYAHTAALLSRLVDWENTLALVYYALTSLRPEILQED